MTTEHHPQCDDDGWDHPGECVIETNPAKLFNVKATAVHLVWAESPEAAIAELASMLRAAGFEVLPGGDAFVSEAVPEMGWAG